MDSNCNNAKDINKNIGILGGTFNPVHCGHLSMANEAIETGYVSCVAFLPLSIAPHKSNLDIADKEDRYNMLVLATQNNPKFSVWRDEIDRAGYTYTIDTLKILKKKYSDCNFVYIIGADALLGLDKWKEINEVFKLCKFLVIYRPGTNLEAVKLKIKELEQNYEVKINIVEDKGYKASSSFVRIALANGENTENLLPNVVYRYIIQHGLYGV